MYSVRKKNCANIANKIRNATVFAPIDVRERKKVKSISGAVTRR